MSKEQYCEECGKPGARRQWKHRDLNRDEWLCPVCEEREEAKA